MCCCLNCSRYYPRDIFAYGPSDNKALTEFAKEFGDALKGDGDYGGFRSDLKGFETMEKIYAYIKNEKYGEYNNVKQEVEVPSIAGGIFCKHFDVDKGQFECSFLEEVTLECICRDSN